MIYSESEAVNYFCELYFRDKKGGGKHVFNLERGCLSKGGGGSETQNKEGGLKLKDNLL